MWKKVKQFLRVIFFHFFSKKRMTLKSPTLTYISTKEQFRRIYSRNIFAPTLMLKNVLKLLWACINPIFMLSTWNLIRGSRKCHSFLQNKKNWIQSSFGRIIPNLMQKTASLWVFGDSFVCHLVNWKSSRAFILC